jgi:hypothetical protein
LGTRFNTIPAGRPVHEGETLMVKEPQPERRKKRHAPSADWVGGVLAERVAELRRSYREIERELGWGHGSLANMLRGRTKITLHHVEALAPIVGATPMELFSEIYGEGVKQTGLPQRFQAADVECLREVLREVLREELAEALKRREQ